jgi:MFS superfamily sulfate permease-like transporter
MTQGPRPVTGDVITGVSLTLILAQQALAYAVFASGPPQPDICAAGLLPLAASVEASSRYLQTGPLGITRLFTFVVLSTMAILKSA